eukprot:6470381-Amphidinium_carterae.1
MKGFQPKKGDFIRTQQLSPLVGIVGASDSDFSSLLRSYASAAIEKLESVDYNDEEMLSALWLILGCHKKGLSKVRAQILPAKFGGGKLSYASACGLLGIESWLQTGVIATALALKSGILVNEELVANALHSKRNALLQTHHPEEAERILHAPWK